jgi:hypothetical protein
MADTNYSVDDVVKAWSDLGGKVNQYVIQEVNYFDDNTKKFGVALVDKVSGSISAFAADVADLQAGLNKLFSRTGDIVVDPTAGNAVSKDATSGANHDNQEVPAVTGLGFGIENTTTTTAKGLDDLNKQPDSKVVPANAQEQLANKTVDVSDVTPTADQSAAEAVKAAVPEGATPVATVPAGATAAEGQAAVDASTK